MKNNPSKADIILTAANDAKRVVAATVSAHRNLALSFLAEAITGGAKRLIEANEADIASARRRGADERAVENMRLDYLSIGTLSGRIRTMAAAADPTDEQEEWKCENGMSVRRVRVPLGVIVTVCGENPRRTVESAAQAIKTGNVMILVRSPATARTAAVFEELLASALSCCALCADTVRGIDYSPETVSELLSRTDAVDAVLLLASKAQNEMLKKNTAIPVICPEYGASHLYIDESADVEEAAAGAVASAKNALCPLNTVLVNWMVSDDFLPVLEGKAMAAGIELCADARVRSTLHGVEEAKEQDKTDARGRLLVYTVNSLSDALKHISKYGAGICEGIYTASSDNARIFCAQADAGAVTLNAPFSRANGFDTGMGADVGLGVDKLSPRGPLGLSGLTTTKYIIKG